MDAKVSFRSPIQIDPFLPFQNGGRAIFTAETVAQQRGPIFAKQALEFSPNFSYQTHMTGLSIGRTHASEYKNSMSHVHHIFPYSPLHESISFIRTPTMSFLSLPNEIILKICKDKGPRDLHSLVLTNRHLANLLSHVLIDSLFRSRRRGGEYARRAFYFAAEREDKTIVRLLIEKGILDILGPGHRRLFGYVKERNIGKAVRTLLDCGVSAELRDRESWSMIHWAVCYGAVAAVKEFISREEVDLNVLDCDNCTPLYTASRGGRKRIVRALVDCPRVDVNIANAQLMTPLGVAAERGDGQMVKILLKHTMIESSLLGTHAIAPIYLAAQSGRVEVVRLLLRDGRCLVNWRDPAGRTALDVAAERRNAAIVQLLKQGGC